jgi:hypothetical protein
MPRLAPCPRCSRHVRLVETSCPFCAAPVTGTLVARSAAPTRGLKRAALFALSATVAASACGEGDDGSDKSQQPSMSSTPSNTSETPGAGGNVNTDPTDTEPPNIQPLYGAPIDDGSGANDDPSSTMGGSGNIEDPGGIGVALYGAPVAPAATE